MATASTYTVAELAEALGCAFSGDGTRVLKSCNTLLEAGGEQLSFLGNAKYAKQLETTGAGCVIVTPGTGASVRREAGLGALAFLEAKDIYFAWQRALVLLHGHRTHKPVGISKAAQIDPSAKIGENVSIHPGVVIAENVTIADNVYIYPNVTIMHDSSIGADTVLYPSVTIYEHCTIGQRCLINAGTVVGSDGFSYSFSGGIHHKIPQSGTVTIEDDVEIGCSSTIERAVLGTTRIGQGTKIGNCVVVGHNCGIGEGNLLISQVGIAGSTTTGKFVIAAGQVGISGHLTLGDNVRIAAQAGVMSDIESNKEVAGSPAVEMATMRRVVVYSMQLPELSKRVKELEKRINKMAPPSAAE